MEKTIKNEEDTTIPNYSISVTLGAGEKGRSWDALVRQAAKKRRMSIGAYVRALIYDQIMKEKTATQPAQPATPTPPAAAV